MGHNQPLLWTGPRRVGTLFYSLARPARRVAGHRASSVIRRSNLRFYTEAECDSWLQGHQRQKPVERPGLSRERFPFPTTSGRIRFLSHWMATSLPYQSPALLWITQWSIWPSSENWHLYYRLRQSYDDHRLLEEAPGHLFLKHEGEDLASFLQIAIQHAWEGYLITELDYVSVFFSHDEYIEFYAELDSNLSDVREVFRPRKPTAG
jgi:hypothetical protein